MQNRIGGFMRDTVGLVVRLIIGGFVALAVFLGLIYGARALGLDFGDDTRAPGTVALVTLALVYKFGFGQSWGEAVVSAFFGVLAMVALLYLFVYFVG